jgi:hypothetical protein
VHFLRENEIDVPVGFRILALQRSRFSANSLLRGGERETRPENAERGQRSVRAVVDRFPEGRPRLIERRKRVDVEQRILAVKFRRRHPDDRDRVIVEANRVADDIRIAAEVRFPELVTENDVGMRELSLVVSRLKQSAEHWLDAEDGEVVRGSFLRPDSFGASTPAHVHVVDDIGGEGAKDRRVAREVFVIRKGHLVRLGQGGIGLRQHDEVFAVRHGHRSEEIRVDDAIDCAVESDSDRQRERDREDKPGSTREGSRGDPDVLPEVRKDLGAVRLRGVPFIHRAEHAACALDVAEFSQRAGASGRRVESVVDQLLRARVDVKRDFVVDVRLDVGPPEAEIPVPFVGRGVWHRAYTGCVVE